MITDALSVANYFIKTANDDGVQIRPLGLMKRVYFAHGFSLALNNQSLLDPRFDVVEAWRFGPVIPSVYHSFKYLRNNPVTTNDYAPRLKFTDEGVPEFYTPTLNDEEAQQVVKAVWQRYRNNTDSELVTLSHQKGTPWDWLYEEGKNVTIPDDYTKLYYDAIVNDIKKKI